MSPLTKEENMDGKVMQNMPVTVPTHVTVGSFTTGKAAAPQGLVLKLELPKLVENQPEEVEREAPPLFGVHIREGIAVVKDWMKKP
jgi:hypothetical protein